MTILDLETYWSSELNEEVEIIPVGWTNMPTEFTLYISGTHVVAYKRLEEVEDYLDRYFVMKGA